MIRNKHTIYTYTFEETERMIVKNWCKENKIKEKELCNMLGISQVHLSRILNGKRNASATIKNRMRNLKIYV
jgi:transcriptional regulator with XRE-family HTH domain